MNSIVNSDVVKKKVLEEVEKALDECAANYNKQKKINVVRVNQLAEKDNSQPSKLELSFLLYEKTDDLNACLSHHIVIDLT